MLSSLSFALTRSRFCSADRVGTFISARRRLTTTLNAVSGSGLLQICFIVSSSNEKLTVTNKLSTSFCRVSFRFSSFQLDFFIASQVLSSMSGMPCTTVDTHSHFSKFLTPSQDHDDKTRMQNGRLRHLQYVSEVHTVQQMWRTFEQNATRGSCLY